MIDATLTTEQRSLIKRRLERLGVWIEIFGLDTSHPLLRDALVLLFDDQAEQAAEALAIGIRRHDYQRGEWN